MLCSTCVVQLLCTSSCRLHRRLTVRRVPAAAAAGSQASRPRHTTADVTGAHRRRVRRSVVVVDRWIYCRSEQPCLPNTPSSQSLQYTIIYPFVAFGSVKTRCTWPTRNLSSIQADCTFDNRVTLTFDLVLTSGSLRAEILP